MASIHPPSLLAEAAPLVCTEEIRASPGWSEQLLLNGKEYLSYMGKGLSVRGENIEPDSLIPMFLNQMHCYKEIDAKQFKYLL